jgi:hypothetical protein
MTWQGFAFPRWRLGVLAAVAAIGGPIAVYAAVSSGDLAQAALSTLAMLGYAVAAALLVLSPAVRQFVDQRRRLLDREADPR